MADYSFLQKLGVFAIPGFLTPEECAQWRSVAAATGGKEAMILKGEKGVVAEDYRKTLDVFVQDPVREALETKLQTLRPEMERYFEMELGRFDPVRCLLYRPGDFFRMHVDATPEEKATEEFAFLHQRRLTVLVYLNDPQHGTEPYEGGTLSLFGLLGGVAGKEFGFPVDVETGLLIVFRSTVPHEVSPVESGKRFSLVTWFLAHEK